MDGGRGGVWDGRTPPSGVVAGFRRDVVCNVSETKNRIAPRHVVLAQNAKSRLRPLGGMKPAHARQAGTFPFPRLRGKVPEGRKGDKVVKRRRCWVLPLPLLLLRRCRQRLYIFLSVIALPCYFKSCQAASVLGLLSGNFSLPPFTGEGARRAEGGG